MEGRIGTRNCDCICICIYLHVKPIEAWPLNHSYIPNAIYPTIRPVQPPKQESHHPSLQRISQPTPHLELHLCGRGLPLDSSHTHHHQLPRGCFYRVLLSLSLSLSHAPAERVFGVANAFPLGNMVGIHGVVLALDIPAVSIHIYSSRYMSVVYIDLPKAYGLFRTQQHSGQDPPVSCAVT